MHATPARFLILCLLVTVAGCATQPSAKDESKASPAVTEYNFDNGLKLLVLPDRRAPIVVSQVWYKVGGSYEPAGLTGISHVLEHMMFKGTKTLGPNEFSRIIAANGGRENAFTGRDYTAYFQSLEKSRLPIAFELEADRMHNLVLSGEEFAKEVEVVKEERRLRTEDRPEAFTYEKFMSAAYRISNYRNPIIGWPEDLDNMSVDDLRVWYERYYAPNNAIIVVVGDVEPDEVYRLAKEHFRGIPRRPVAAAPDQSEPPQTRTRAITVSRAARVPYLLIGFHVPVIATATRDWEPYALEILAYVLDGGKSARMSKELVRKQQVATSVGVGYDPRGRAATLFLIDANPAAERAADEVKKAIMEQIQRLQDELISAEEVSTVKAQIVASKVFESDSVFYQGMRLGVLETNGLDWRLADQINQRLQAVTPDQVREVARKYLRPENMTIAVLEPKSVKQTKGETR